MIRALRQQLDQRTISATELTQQYLDRISQKNAELNAFVAVTSDYALEQAKVADKAIAAGNTTILTGLPYNLKDVFCVTGVETTACSNILRGYIPPYTATAVERLNGAVLLGKTNTDEFTMGASSETSCFGPTRNPHDPSKVAGGSSGGPAASIAADLSVFSLGTDTGGSIRLPAAFCGVVGLRPTYGRVSRYGVLSMASSMDTIGPLTHCVEDMAIVMEQIAGHDIFDSTTPNRPVEQYSSLLEKPLTGLRVGLPQEYFEMEGLDPAMRAVIEQAIEQLKKLGVTIKPISLPHTKYAVPTYYIITPCEVSSNMARYDGIKYGYRAKAAEDIDTVYKLSRSQGFGAEVKRRIMIGSYALSAGYYDQYYLKAMKVRTLIRHDFINAFAEVDVIATPATTGPAFNVGEKATNVLQMYTQDIFTAPGSLAGIPGLVVPCGQVAGLPAGIQLLGPQWSETTLLQVGYQLEQAL